MAGIFERITSLAGTEAAKAINLAHETFTGRMGVHGHTGRAIIETVAEVCRNHPNLVGIGAGLLVEQLLVEEKHRHDAHVAAAAAAGRTTDTVAPAQAAFGDAPLAIAGPASTPHPDDPAHPDHPDHHLHFPHVAVPHIDMPHLAIPTLRLATLKPGKIAAEVFGALVLLKIGAAGSHLFQRKNKHEVWFAPAAHIHLLSGTLGAYYLVKALKSPKVSSWRNAAVALFLTDAIKPLLRVKNRPIPTLDVKPQPMSLS